jgi:serine protease Do
MNHSLRYLTAAMSLAAVLPALSAADDAKTDPRSEKVEKKELRVLAAPDHMGPHTEVQVRPRVMIGRSGDGEKEPVTFLGVITTPVSPTLSAQLGLTAGSGLVVNHVDEKSPAEAVLKEHDILLKLDDQLLVDQHQLSVLIRQHKEGDEVTLTFVRAGKQTTAKVKLGKHEVPKISGLFTQPVFNGAGNGFAWAQSGEGRFDLAIPGPDGPRSRADVDRVLELIESHGGQPTMMRIDRANGPGFRAMSINTGNSNLVYSDDDGSLELTVKDDKKSLVAKNKKGEQVFAGPVNTPDERKALPDDVRGRLEKIEGMREMSFHTDSDFQGTETRVLRPQPRGISLPLPETAPQSRPARPPLFF